MNFLVLSLTCMFYKSVVRYGWVRMAAAAVAGAAAQAFLLVAVWYPCAVAANAVLVVPCMLFYAFGREPKRRMLLRLIASWLAIVLLNGVASAVYNLTGIAHLYLYTALVVLFATWLLVMSGKTALRQQKRQMTLVIANGTKEERCIGFYDSGNVLTIPETGAPVHIAEASLLCALVDENTPRKHISYRTLGRTDGELTVYCLEKMQAEPGKRTAREWQNVWMGMAEPALFCGKSYRVIVNAAAVEMKE